MEQGIKKQKSKYTDREKIKINKKFFIYLFFLLLSVLFWYLNALSKDYVTTVDYPVRYIRFPQGKTVASKLPETLSLRVRGFGYNLLKIKYFEQIRPISLPIDHFGLKIAQKGNQYLYYLPTVYAKETVSNQLGADLQLVGITPDTLVFDFTDVVEKKVPVKPNLDLQFEKQFMQNGKLVLRPDCVIVSGPQTIIDTIKSIQTILHQAKNLKDTLAEELKLESVPRLTLNTSKVWVFLPVEKFTEMTFSIPVETDYLPEDLRVRTFPGSIKVSFRVGISAYNKINPYMFRASIDYNNLIANPGIKAKVTLVKQPAMAKDVRIYPKSVEYLIEK